MPGTDPQADTPASPAPAGEQAAVPETGSPAIQSEGEQPAAEAVGADSQPDEAADLPWSSTLKEGTPLDKDLLKQIASLEKKHGVPHKAFTTKNQEFSKQIEALKAERQQLAEQSQKAMDFQREALPILEAIANDPEAKALVERLLAGQPQAQQAPKGVDREEIGRTIEEKLAQREEQAMFNKFLEEHPVLSEDGYFREQFDLYIESYAQKGIVSEKQVNAAYKLAQDAVNEARGVTSGTSGAALAAKASAGALPSGKARTSGPKSPLQTELEDYGRLSPYAQRGPA